MRARGARLVLLLLCACRRGQAGDPAVASWRPPVTLAAGVTAREGRARANADWRLVDISIDPGRVELRVGGLNSGKLALDQMVPTGTVAAVNGGYFDARLQPVGWLVDRSVELSPRSRRTAGGVVAAQKDKLYIGPAAQLPFAPEFVVQNSPRLVEDQGKIGIRRDDGKRAPRTVACNDGTRLHLFVALALPGDGPTLLETARMMAESPARGGLGCREALNLDGGPSTGVWLPESSGIAGSQPRAPIAYAIAVVPR